MMSAGAIADALHYLDERALQVDLPYDDKQRAAVHAVYWAVSQCCDRMDARSVEKLKTKLKDAESLIPEQLRQNQNGNDVAEFIPSLLRLAKQVIQEHGAAS